MQGALRLLRNRTGLALIVALGYYLGVLLGESLRFPPATTSVLWPPNSILTAALLLTPYRRWWICIAAAFPVHVLMQLNVGWPMPMIVTLFATNCAEALIAAGLMRRFTTDPIRFDSLRSVSTMALSVGLAAPILSSFADAAAVHFFNNEPYWSVWQTRVFANSLTGLSIVPLVLVAATTVRFEHLRQPSRIAEISIVLLGLAFGLTFWTGGGISRAIPGVPATVFLLPFFFWAAVRFGVGGVSVSVFFSALIVSIAARQGHRPFVTLPASESLIALQIYLIVMAIPLFAVAALLSERRHALATLSSRLRSEKLMSWASGSLVQVPSNQIDAVFASCLERVGTFLAVDRAFIVQLTPTREALRIVTEWNAEGIDRLPDSYSCTKFPWAVSQALQNTAVVCDDIDGLPADAVRDREMFTSLGLKSALLMPLAVSGHVVGAVSIHMTRTARHWDSDTVTHVRRIGDVLASALERKRSDDALRASESMNAGILTSLSSLVAVLDRDGVVIAANERWRDLIHRPAGSSLVVVGANYLELWPRLGMSRGPLTSEGHDTDTSLAAVTQVLSGRSDWFSCEYACDDRWYVMTVVPLRRAEGGAVVTHTDVTERKRAETEAQHARQELAHFNRVSTMGELTASLAHQLNQPLASILSNAEAAMRFLNARQPDMGQLRAILTDIIDDDKRAGAVVRRTREILTNSRVAMDRLDLNVLVRDVALLMASDAVIRNVSVVLDLSRGAQCVHGDRVQLQQVVLNLLVNAIEAVTEQPLSQRGIIVSTGSDLAGVAVISVRDSGSGFSADTEAAMFEPFVTTKPGGMGMGLAIARSIVESHGGRVWAENNPDRGATMFVSLPTADA